MAATFTVEDGTGVTDANSYTTTSFADQWSEDHENNTAYTSASSGAKQQALRMATLAMQQWFAHRWRGERLTTTQGLHYPIVAITNGRYNDEDLPAFPDEIQEVCAYLAIRYFEGVRFVADKRRKDVAASYGYGTPDGKSEDFGGGGGGGMGVLLTDKERLMPAVALMMQDLIHSGPRMFT
jgi:hypothetical protein